MSKLGRRKREVEGVSRDAQWEESIRRPIALVVQLPQHALSFPFPAAQTIFTGGDAYLLDVLKTALRELLRRGDLEVDALRALWHAHYHPSVTPSATDPRECILEKLSRSNNNNAANGAYSEPLSPCGPCQLQRCAEDNRGYIRWLRDNPEGSSDRPPAYPRDATLVEDAVSANGSGEHMQYAVVFDDEHDIPEEDLQWLSKRQSQHLKLLHHHLSDSIAKEKNLDTLLRFLHRLYDYEFPAHDWYIGVAPQADEITHAARLSSFAASESRHEESQRVKRRLAASAEGIDLSGTSSSSPSSCSSSPMPEKK